MTECLSSYDEEHIQNTGLPTQKLNNVYSKWGVGGFGMVFTGNIFVDPVKINILAIFGKKF